MNSEDLKPLDPYPKPPSPKDHSELKDDTLPIGPKVVPVWGFIFRILNSIR